MTVRHKFGLGRQAPLGGQVDSIFRQVADGYRFRWQMIDRFRQVDSIRKNLMQAYSS